MAEAARTEQAGPQQVRSALLTPDELEVVREFRRWSVMRLPHHGMQVRIVVDIGADGKAKASGGAGA